MIIIRKQDEFVVEWVKYGADVCIPCLLPPMVDKKEVFNYLGRNSKMSRIQKGLERYPSLRAKQQKKIMIEELMFSQMQENLGKNIVDYVDQTRQSLQHVGLVKTRKIVLAVEKNLNKFMKGCYHNKIRLASDFYANLKSYDQANENFPTSDVFSSKLLNKQLQKIHSHRHTIQQQGALRRNLISANKKIRRVESANVVLSNRKSQCYSAKHSGRNENIFNLIVQK